MSYLQIANMNILPQEWDISIMNTPYANHYRSTCKCPIIETGHV